MFMSSSRRGVPNHSETSWRRAASLGDGWYGLWRSPDQVRESVAQIQEFGPPAQFEMSLRVVTSIGSRLPDKDPETSLQGDADAILHRIQQYSEAGVDRI